MSEPEELELIESPPLPRDLREVENASNVLTNFHGDGDESWAFVSRCKGVECGKGESLINTPFELKYWLLHHARVRNKQTHEVSTLIRTVLVSADGHAFAFVAESIIDSLRDLIQFKGRGPYDPPLPIVIKSGTSGGGNRFYTIEPMPRRQKAARG